MDRKIKSKCTAKGIFEFVYHFEISFETKTKPIIIDFIFAWMTIEILVHI